MFKMSGLIDIEISMAIFYSTFLVLVTSSLGKHVSSLCGHKKNNCVKMFPKGSAPEQKG